MDDFQHLTFDKFPQVSLQTRKFKGNPYFYDINGTPDYIDEVEVYQDFKGVWINMPGRTVFVDRRRVEQHNFLKFKNLLSCY